MNKRLATAGVAVAALVGTGGHPGRDPPVEVGPAVVQPPLELLRLARHLVGRDELVPASARS